ncbi:hypothetical protein P175DRAFT_0489532 [Aspergillus ochraceoroseus IBT 24754]|uniref:Uncharacterized protein n=1 Tax=Aspergillus ochraceoroseus IBT 24754 TaxID=1392256 RepID=A0A2T5M794_9EURO|nr:uncharacterized protein P175DRAFT_0489532 [Aspergillus ochraceoroseus IBT 24754]PTU24411.1 hypothetical protein P175DRAFT_0489532 [Aspergillus ochraceoroseus IBT 24754]
MHTRMDTSLSDPNPLDYSNAKIMDIFPLYQTTVHYTAVPVKAEPRTRREIPAYAYAMVSNAKHHGLQGAFCSIWCLLTLLNEGIHDINEEDRANPDRNGYTLYHPESIFPHHRFRNARRVPYHLEKSLPKFIQKLEEFPWLSECLSINSADERHTAQATEFCSLELDAGAIDATWKPRAISDHPAIDWPLLMACRDRLRNAGAWCYSLCLNL